MKQLSTMLAVKPSRRVGLVTFNNEVCCSTISNDSIHVLDGVSIYYHTIARG